MNTNHSIRRAVTAVALAAGIGATTAAAALADPAAGPGMHRLDGAAEVKIPSSLGVSQQNPCWSPNLDTPQLVFTQFSDSYNNGDGGHGFSNTWVVNPDGTGASLLSGKPAHDAVNEPGSCWSSKNWIAWSGDEGGSLNADEIVVAQPNGGHVHALTGALVSRLSAWEPSFSPDGSWLVFESHPRCRGVSQPGCANGQDYSDQGVIDKVRFSATGEGTQLSQLTCPGANQADQEPNWAPTKMNLIVFQRNTVDAAGNVTSTDLFTMNPNDRNCHHIRNMTDNRAVDGVPTSTTGASSDASFSPDNSSQIVYSGTAAGPVILNGKTCDTSNASIFLLDVNLDGPPQPVTCTTGGIYDGAPSYSPDGSTIAFESCDPHPTAKNCPADDTRHSSYTRIWAIAAP